MSAGTYYSRALRKKDASKKDPNENDPSGSSEDNDESGDDGDDSSKKENTVPVSAPDKRAKAVSTKDRRP